MGNSKLSNNALTIAQDRYFMNEKNETWEDCARRCARVVSSIENSKSEEYFQKFFEIIYNMDFLPGGRILRNAGRPRGSMFNCVSKNMELISKDGFKKVTDLNVGDEIINGLGRFAVVKNVAATKFEKTLKRIIVSRFGRHNPIDLTEDHLLLVFNTTDGISWKAVSKLDKGNDYLVLPKVGGFDKKSIVNINEIVDIKELYGKEYEVVNNNIFVLNGEKSENKYNQKISPLKNKININHDLCKLVGFYLSEGTSEGKENSVIFSFNSKETNYINETIKLIEKIFGIKAVQRNNTGNSIQVVANSQILNRFFSNLFGNISWNKKLPWWWLSLNLELLKTTLLYYLKGDGHLEEKEYGLKYTAVSVSKMLIYQLFMIGNKLNLQPSFLQHNPKKRNGMINGKEYYNPNYILYFSTIKQDFSFFYEDFNDNYLYYPIISIETIDYRDEVYDIEMVGDPSFMFVNAVCHNCYVLPIGDSREEIGQYYKDSLILWGEGGGIGVNISELRPHGDPIKGVGGHSSGPVSFLEASDAIAKTVESGGSRRAAALACMNVSHPDIIRFINAKIKDGKLPHFNISVAATNDFFESVEADKEWEFKFAHKSYGTKPAKEIWDKVIENMVKHAEPGLLNWSNIIKNNSYYYDPVSSTNPCLVGKTMVYVADGRRYVSIKQLADDGKDVPVFCYNEKTQKPEVKMMRRPRLTGRNKRILKVNLDDGSSVRCTENHKFYMKDGGVKRADDLCSGDRLHHMVSYNAAFEEVFKFSNSESQDYAWINDGFSKSVCEHRLIAEFKIGRKLRTDEVVHHKNHNGLDNSVDNLEVMTKEEHDKLHSKNMLGENNPMNRFPEKNWLIKQDHSGNNNGRFKGFTPDQVFDLAVGYSIKLGRKITQLEWFDYCKKKDIPNSKYSLGKYTSHSKMLLSAAEKARVMVTRCSVHTREYKRYIELLKETDMDIFFESGSIYVNKTCEWCGILFVTKWGNRERAFCSRKCSSDYGWSDEKSMDKFYSHYENRQQETRNAQIVIYNELKKTFSRDPLKKEWMSVCKKNNVSSRIRSSNESGFNEYCFTSYKELKQATELNFKVVSVEEDGHEDVYNGTVDGNHNFYTMTSEEVGNNKKPKYNNMLSRQCGEAVLSPYDVCDLGSLVLPNFITGTVNTNWKKLEETIKLAVRFLDDVIEINKYVLKEIDIKAHNSRRIGLGVMGLAEYLFAKKVRYGSKRAIGEVERLMRFIRDTVYETLVELSVEKGAFPKFDPAAYGKASFIRKLPASLRMSIKEHGVRCVTGMAIAPTGCQKENTLVITSDGILKLSEIGKVDGEKWQDIDLNVAQEHSNYVKATKFFINGNTDTKKIFLSSGAELECTLNHQYRVLRNGDYIWCSANDLVKGDLFVVPLNTYRKNKEVELVPPEITHGNQNNIKSHSHTSPDLAEFVGIYFGDGSNHKKGIRINCNVNNESEYLHVANLGYALFGIKPTFEDNGRGCMSVCFNSTVLLKWFARNGILKEKSSKLFIPTIIRRFSRESLIMFVKGLWFADGSFNAGSLYIDTASKEMAQQLLTIVRALGKDVNIQEHFSGKGSKMYRVHIVKTARKCLNSENYKQLFELGLSMNCTVDDVVDIEDSCCPTYDLEVPETITYIANSVISHNTISLLAEVTSGIEPLFMKAYKRKDRVSERIYVHDIYKGIISKSKKVPDWYVDTNDLSPSDHFEVQSAVQKYVDGAVSKTINMPANTTPNDLSKLTLEYIYDLKGVTVYVDGSKFGQILNKINYNEIRKHLKDNGIQIDENVGIEAVQCASGKCDL